MSPKPQALIFGASGITGWAITNNALIYPTPTTFSRIVGLSNRPLSPSDAHLPSDPRLQLYSGLDLSRDAATNSEYLRGIENISEITHVYFAAYAHRGWGEEDAEARKKENVDFITNAVRAVEAVCPNLEFWTFPTGGKWYGFEYGTKIHLSLPVRETDPRVPAPYGDNIFYYPQIDALANLSQGKKWNFADIRPDAIVGFVPNHNAMNIAEPLALYLSLWKSFNGAAKEVPFPGSNESFVHLHSDCSQDQLARFSIFVSMNGEKTAGKAYNIASVDYPVSWKMVWPGISAWFGLKGSGPLDQEAGLSGEAWVRSLEGKWEEWETTNGLRRGVLEKTCWDFLTMVAGEYSTFDRHYDLTQARSTGFNESVDPVGSYVVAFERMRRAHIIP